MARRTARQWSRLVARWKSSGLSATEFGAKARINARSLQWWSWALGKRAAQNTAQETEPDAPVETTPAFLPVRIVQRDAAHHDSPSTPGEPLEIVVDDRFLVRVGPGFDELTLRRVLGILRDSELD